MTQKLLSSLPYRVAALLMLLLLAGPGAVQAQALNGTKAIPGDYASLTAAFADLNAKGVDGPLLLELQAGYTPLAVELSAGVTYSFAGGSTTNTITVRPAAGANNLSIGGSYNGPLFSISGGRNLVLDGRPGGSGAVVAGSVLATDLTIANSSIGGAASAVGFSADATTNVVQHCQLRAAAVGSTLGAVVFFGSGTNGNSNNTVQYNDLRESAGGTPTVGVLSTNAKNAANTIQGNNIYNFFRTGANDCYGIYLNNAGDGWNIVDNSVYQTANRTGPGNSYMYGVNLNAGNGHLVSGNYIGGQGPNCGVAGTPLAITGTAAAYKFAGIISYNSTTTANSFQGNTIANIAWLTTSSGAGTGGVFSGVFIGSGSANIGTVTGNKVGTATLPLTVTVGSGGSGAGFYGISTNTSGATGTLNIAQNTIQNMIGIGSSVSLGCVVKGLLIANAATASISRNRLFNLASTVATNAAALCYGIDAQSTTNTINNNIIGDLRAPAANNSTNAVIGISLSSASVANVYHNTVNLNASSTGATFGSSALSAATAVTLDLRNNLLVNTSTAGSTATSFTAVLRRSAAVTTTSFQTTSNNNLLYAGTPTAKNLLYSDGTIAAQTLAAYKTALVVSGREGNSVTENIAFASTSGADAAFLSPDPTKSTQAADGGTPVASVVVDYNGTARSATTPDIGAYEGAFAPFDLGVDALLTPGGPQCATPGLQAISVRVRNFSAGLVTTSALAVLKVTGTLTKPDASTVALSYTVPAATTIAAGGTLNVTFSPNQDFSAPGTYTFSGLTTTLTDGQTPASTYVESNATNNTLAPAPTVVVNPLPTAALASPGPTTVCTGSTVTVNTTLTGTAPYTVTVTATDANGTTTQTQTAPLSTYSLSYPLALTTTFAITALTDASGCPATTATLPSITFTVTDQSVYTGAAAGDGSNWFNASNWSSCMPSSTIDAVIPAGLANYPNLNTAATAAVRTLTVANGASLSQSAGTLNVYGSFTNNTPAASLSLTGGTVAFRGATPGMSGVARLASLAVNLSSPAATLALANDLTATGTVAMAQGVLSTGSFTLTLPVGATITETDASYVLGKVAAPGRSLSSATPENFGGIGLTLTPDAASTVFPGLTPVVRTTGTALAGAGTSQSITRYFDIQPATNAGLNVATDFSYLTHELNGISAANLLLFRSVSGTGGPWAYLRPNAVVSNTITKTGIADFSIWTLGDAANPLPVELSAFSATREGSETALAWATASEKNNRGFEVQVSTDGRSYRVLGFVASPTSTSMARREYTFRDREAGKTGLRYYRLHQLDVDGTTSFSPVRTVRFNGESTAGIRLAAAPSPFREQLKLTVSLPEAAPAAELLLTDVAGRVLRTQHLEALPAGTTELELPGGAKLASGVYFVQLAVPGRPSCNLRVMKE